MTTIEHLRDVLEEHAPRLLTAGQIADGTGAAISTVMMWTQKSSFPTPVLGAGKWRGNGVRVWHQDDLLAWLLDSSSSYPSRGEYYESLKAYVA